MEASESAGVDGCKRFWSEKDLSKQVLRKAFATSNAVSDAGNVLSRPLSRADIKSSRSFVLVIEVLNSCFSSPVFCLFF